MKSVVIVGGGLVGSLCACFMARRGYQVELYEKREDIRTAKEVKGRSINLNLSHRGRKALQELKLEEKILKEAIPMKGRMLHDLNGELKYVPYDSVFNQCGYSISRAFLNKVLLNEAERYPNVNLYFKHKLTGANFEDGTVTIMNLDSGEVLRRSPDLTIGSDGAYSSLRRSMQQMPMFQFEQRYIEHGYLELTIDPKFGEKMSKESLHIWPRGEFMMIALPNRDDSWTVTLFMPFEEFEKLRSGEEEIMEFFSREFGDSVPLLGRDEIVGKVRGSLLPLVTVKCDPFHAGEKFLLIGDAAHAVVPFYGQGMNAGFEDCTILDEILDATSDNIEIAIANFSKTRVEDAHTIADLAMYNYVEMRDLVNKSSFKLRKMFDEAMFKRFPSRWVPLYWSVCFSSMRYSECLKNKAWQDKVVKVSVAVFFIVTATFFVFSSIIN